jgi:hypothetical protein
LFKFHSNWWISGCGVTFGTLIPLGFKIIEAAFLAYLGTLLHSQQII